MTQPRQALTISIVYSIPLLIWLLCRLELIEWSTGSLQHIFRQTLAGLLLLQLLATALLFINPPEARWQDDALGILHIVLFPLPVLVLTALTGSVSLSVILKGLLLVSSFGLLAFLLQRGGSRLNIMESGRALVHVLLATLVWNYRDLWWDWLGL